ncbi:MAG TPA: translocation/assembly module TamB domain-containing protein [Candidatus Eisenbacteria bacterium]|nr:translocation/assembly module TamB domain-containing protein [Candidatus Eisenbacteria bacterium]
MPDDRVDQERHRRSNRGVLWIVLGVLALVALLAVGGGVGVLANLFATGDAGLSRRVMSVMNGALGSDSTRFACDRIYGTLLRGAVLERPRLLVRSGGQEVTWATASRARVEYDLWSLLVSPRRDLTVSLDSLRVTLARDAERDFIMPRFRRGTGKPGKSETRIRLTLRGASLVLPEEGASLQGLAGSGVIVLGPGGSSVLVERLGGVVRGVDGEAARPIRMDGMVAFQDSLWRLDPVRVELAATRLSANGDWDSRGGRLREGTLRLDPFVLEEVLPLFGVEGVEGTLRGDVDLAGAPGDGNASGCLGGEIEGERIDTLLVRAHLAREGIVVDHLETKLRGATVSGRGRVDRSGALEADLVFDHANPVAIPWWEAPAGMPSGVLAGEARLRIGRGRPRPDIRVAAALRASRVGRLSIDRANVSVHAPPQGGLLVDSLLLFTPGARVAMSGAIDAAGALRAVATASIADLGRMGALTAPMEPRGGAGRIAATLGGTTKAPTIELTGAFSRPSFESGLHAESLIVAASGALAPTLDVRGTTRVAGLAAKDRRLGDVTASFEGGREMRIDRFEGVAGDTTLSMRGFLVFGAAGLTARVDSMRLVGGALRAVASAPVNVSLSKGRLRASPLVFDLEPGRLEADLDWDVSAGRIDLRGAVTGLELARVGRGSGRTMGGVLRAQFLAAGRGADPDVTVRATVESPRIGSVTADSLQANLDYTPGVLGIQSLRWDVGAASSELRGSLRTGLTIEAWLRALSNGDRRWTENASLALEASADSFDLAALAPADTTLRTLAGAASFRARIGGTVASPILSFDGRVPGFSFHTLHGDVAALEGSYRDRRLTLERLELRQEKGVMKATGTIPVDLSPFATKRLLRDEPLRLSLSANETDFSALTSLSALVATSSGSLSGDAEVTGTPAHPKLTGTVRLRDGRLRFAGRYEILEAIQVDGTFDEERLTLTRLEAREGKRGRIVGEGSWRWSGAGAQLPPGSIGPPGQYSVNLKATDCVVTDREYYLFQFNGAFVVANGRTESGIVKPRVTGTGSVSRGELAFNLSAPAGEPPAPLPFLYDIRADFPSQFKYRQLDTEVELAGSLQLRNEGDLDIALGTLTVKGGQFYFLTRKFGNLTGEVNFNSLERMDPFVTLDAQTRVRRMGPVNETSGEHVVNLAVTGRASQLQIRPWDTEGTSPSDLWRELSVGQFSSADHALAEGGSDPLAGMAFRDLPIRDYLFRNAERWIASSGFIDTIDLKSGAQAGASTAAVGGPIDLGLVGVGKYVTQDLFLKYSRDFTGQSENQVTAEYRVTRHLLLRGQQIQRKQTSNEPAQEYNLDLKIRVEY